MLKTIIVGHVCNLGLTSNVSIKGRKLKKKDQLAQLPSKKSLKLSEKLSEKASKEKVTINHQNYPQKTKEFKNSMALFEYAKVINSKLKNRNE